MYTTVYMIFILMLWFLTCN